MHQIVQPGGVERETLWVGLAIAVILIGAVATVSLRASTVAEQEVAVHEIDARAGLTPAEQGVFADLLAAAEDIAAAPAALPVDVLAAEGLPPFVRDAAWQARGAHAWSSWFADHGEAFYLGQSGEPALAGSLLLRLADGRAHVWLKPGAAHPPAHPDADALRAAGWKRVVFSYSAGVTR